MNWVLIIGLSWLVIALIAALIIGRVLRAVDHQQLRKDAASLSDCETTVTPGDQGQDPSAA